MPGSTNKIKLIITGEKEEEGPMMDRGDGVTHGLNDYIKKKVQDIEIDVDKLKDNIEHTVKNIESVLIGLKDTVSEQWKLDGITIGLCITAEGSVGIASAGVETSIEVSFSPKK
jgi:hypothetical protein